MSDIDNALNILGGELSFAETIRTEFPQRKRHAASLALKAILKFIRSIDEFKSKDLTVSLSMLGAALEDLERGIVASIVLPVKKSGRPSRPSNWEAIKGHAAATMEILMEVSNREAAARAVAAVLKKEEIRLGSSAPLTWRAIAGWRDEIKSRRKRSVANITFLRVVKNFASTKKKFDHLNKPEQLKKEITSALIDYVEKVRD